MIYKCAKFIIIILSFSLYIQCFAYTAANSVVYLNIPKLYINNFSHKTYSEENCYSRGADEVKTIKINYSQRTDNPNEYKVGWNYQIETELAHYLKPTLGGEVQIMRCLPPGKWVFLGKGNVENLNGNNVEARIYGIDTKSIESDKTFNHLVETKNLYWRPMVGDIVFPLQKVINKKIAISPKIELASEEIFISSELNQFSYEISKQGEELLKEIFEIFKNKRGRLIIEGYVLTSGNREDLRIESLMRAQAVLKFLANTFELDQTQIIAVGYGNDWFKPGMQRLKTWPKKNIISGITIKMLYE
ncbi:OmpA family protein [Spirobacillus cienkowskii]|uniref:OmpA family protein n=1 Tax=Spirobacillus cienkowskii TaxID=495820 RepID=UPI0030D0F634